MMTDAPKIIYEDNDIVIIDKPAGMVVNKMGKTTDNFTVQQWAEKKLVIRKSFKGDEARIDNGLRKASPNSKVGIVTDNRTSEFLRRGGIVHRLDKETSGILIIARSVESFEKLKKRFKEKEVRKAYIALCHGEIRPEKGAINIPIGRLPWNRVRFGVLPQGREARTRYRVISNFQFQISNFKTRDSKKSSKDKEPLSLVEVYPETGRTHQIRVHMQYIGHPIFADELYAGRKISKRDRTLLPRHFLHASRIVFEHPRTGERVEFESPLPLDLVNFLSKFGNPQV